jgi:hypothetical protein
VTGPSTSENLHAGAVDDQLLEGIDLAPTFLAIASTHKPSAMKGKVLLGEWTEAARFLAFGVRDRCGVLQHLRSVLEKWLDETDDQGRFLEPSYIVTTRGVTHKGSGPNAGYAQGDLKKQAAQAR